MSNSENDILNERFELAFERVKEVGEETGLLSVFADYFRAGAQLLLEIAVSGELEKNGECGNVDCGKGDCQAGDRPAEAYQIGYLSPAYAKDKLGEEWGGLLSFLYYELYSLKGLVYPGNLLEKVIRMELFLEVYAAFAYEEQENGGLPEYETIRQSLYWFAFDYADVAAELYLREPVCRTSTSILYGFEKDGERTRAVKQCQWYPEHGEDEALIRDKAYLSRRQEVFKTALAKNGNECKNIKKYVAHLA